jgi:hypothetical protein
MRGITSNDDPPRDISVRDAGNHLKCAVVIEQFR